ncbi:ATP-binding cassette domain-containing protein [Hyphomicrobium sp.]|uniref:ABC transporter ATP-binding protein n=1 Tax=Hyphomicrobium sp. TaxID=82 RepID=UPI0025BD036B|nr:ATP-binding cassette domain-containing protein [Hyphomicrobium sp.]MCC7250270.1 ATP-binding cassette domain-containing protein [Hyphomicrobium sp.]
MLPGSAESIVPSSSAAADSSAAAFPLFRLADVSFEISGRRVLDGLTATLETSHMFALVGPNGSGKSSLLRLLARQEAPSNGRLDYRGRSIAAIGRREFARSVAFLPQFPPPADSMNVRELVALGRFPWHGPLGRFTERDAEKTEEALRRTDLLQMADRIVDTLSGGERQRVWLAMMLAQETNCLLLDEPTSALDVAHQVEILALIRELSYERAMGVVIVLHDVNLAARYCDEILALKSGRLIARGPATEIVTSTVLEQIYGIEMGVVPNPSTGLPMSYVR